MSLCFCPDVKNEDELLLMLRQGRWDKRIYDYLVEIMSEQENRKLRYAPVELFEMQARLLDENDLLCYHFWSADDSGIYNEKKWKRYMSKEQREIFDLFVARINEAYESLLRLVAKDERICVEPVDYIPKDCSGEYCQGCDRCGDLRPVALMKKEELIALTDKKFLSKEEVLQIRRYYMTNDNCTNDWFGCAGVDGNGFIYEYKFNYRKGNEETLRFWSDYQL